MNHKLLATQQYIETIMDTMDAISKEDIAILLINGRDGGLRVELEEGDMVSIFPPVGGG